MKQMLNTLLMGLLVLLFFTACNQGDTVLPETNPEAIYSPTGVQISSSMEELENAIATAIKVDRTNVAVTSISFSEVTEGFIADIEYLVKSTGTTTNLIYMSKDQQSKVTFEDSVVELNQAEDRCSRVPFIVGVTYTCYCTFSPIDACFIEFNPIIGIIGCTNNICGGGCTLEELTCI